MKTTDKEIEKEKLLERAICKVPRISFAYRKYTMRISFYSLYCLDLPVYIRFLINPEKKQFAVQASSKEDIRSVKVDYFNQYEVKMRHVSALLVHQIFEMGGWNKNLVYRIEGKYIEKHKLVVFNLADAKNVSFKYKDDDIEGDDNE